MTLVLIAGQSNALGFGNTGPAPYQIQAQTYIWDNLHGGWSVMMPGQNTGTLANPEAWGPEVEFANRWRAAHGPEDVLAIVKVVKGETGLAADPAAMDWSPHSRGEMFDQATAVFNAARASIHYASADGLLWMQGETDARDAAKAAAYQANLTEAFSDMRAAWHVEGIAFGRIADSTPYFEQVRWAQYLVDQADPLATSFDTYDYSRQPDGLHYDAAGQVELGRALYDGWLTL